MLLKHSIITEIQVIIAFKCSQLSNATKFYEKKKKLSAHFIHDTVTLQYWSAVHAKITSIRSFRINYIVG